MKKVSVRNEIMGRFILENPEASALDVAKKFKTTATAVYQLRSRIKSGKWRPRRRMNETAFSMVGDAVDTMIDRSPPPSRLLVQQVDMINHPPHYKVGGIETLDFIDAKNLSYALGNVVKYITRAKHKGSEIEDLEKAAFYLAHEISNIKKTNTK